MTDDEHFDTQCSEIVKACQLFIGTPPSEEREALLLRMRALGMKPEHIARFLQVVADVEAGLLANNERGLH